MIDRAFVHRCLHLFVILTVIQTLACRPQDASSSMKERAEALRRAQRATRVLPDVERAAFNGAVYDGLFGAVRANHAPSTLSDHDLDLLYTAAQLTAFYTVEDRHIRDMTWLLDLLRARKLATGLHYKQMYEIFVMARMLTDARQLAVQHPHEELEALPDLRESADLTPGTPTEWVVSLDKKELLRRNVDLSKPAQVVIVSHPLCHFSQAASQAIQADPVLSRIFRSHAKWIAPQDGRLKFEIFQHWNREHPGQETTLVYLSKEWPMIDSWATPTFYFFKNGVLVTRVTGWPKEGQRPELLAALRKIGLLE